MNRLLSRIRRAAGATRRRLAPSPEVAAWRRACRLAERTPRYTHGEIELGPYTLQYSDLLTLCPQWDDIFVRRSLAFTTPAQAPRILDCGANLGLASLFFKRAYPAAKITAFEADPAIARMLAANLRRNGAPDVEVVAAAAWIADGDVAFCGDGADSGAIADHARPAPIGSRASGSTCSSSTSKAPKPPSSPIASRRSAMSQRSSSRCTSSIPIAVRRRRFFSCSSAAASRTP